jgi:uncharacterized membrane-anchored protein
MLARAQILLAFSLLACVMAVTILLMLFHGTMQAVVVTLVSTVVSQLTGAMILACNYFLARSRPRSPTDPNPNDPTAGVVAPLTPTPVKEPA